MWTQAVEVLEARRLFSAAIPGTLSLAAPDLSPTARVGSNALSNGPFLGWTSAHQRVNYVLEVSSTGLYPVAISASTALKTTRVHLEVDGTNLTGAIAVPSTGGWYNWQAIQPIAPLELSAGQHVLTLVIEKGSANFQSAVFTQAAGVGSGSSSDPSAVSGPTLPGNQLPGTSVPSPPLSGNWSLSFDDEFNGSSLTNSWVPHQYWNNGPTIGEGLEESVPANVSVSNGQLQLTARADNSYGPAYTGGLVQTGGIVSKSSQPTFSFKYGYAEARILIPAGAGLWPAFWMLPANHDDNQGEIDIMEMYDADTTSVFGTVHRAGAQEQHADHTGTDLSAGWHTFAVDWEPDHITWYLDGVAYGTTTATSLIPTVAMFPIFDLAVGGKNSKPTTSELPATMSVDYVRIWQQS